MRRALLIPAGLLCLAATSALAQPTVTTHTPPDPNAQAFTPQPSVSLPAGAASATVPRPGDQLGGTPTAPVSDRLLGQADAATYGGPSALTAVR